MRRYLPVLLVPILACAGAVNARGAEISIAGDDCGTPSLLGLSIVLGTSSGIVSCPDSQFGTNGQPGAAGSVTDGLGTPLYGSLITSVGFLVSAFPPDPIVPTGVLPNSTLTMITPFLGGFLVSVAPGAPGISVCGHTSDGFGPSDAILLPVCFPDVVILLSGFAPGTQFTVASVNGVNVVPEPATLGLLSLGLAVIVARRRQLRTRRGELRL